MNYCFPKSVRLRTRRHYQRVSQHFARALGSWIIVEARQSKNALTRLGITVTRRYGNAVQRNRFKRLTREAFRLRRTSFPQGFDLNVKPRGTAVRLKAIGVLLDLERCVQIACK